MSRQAIDVSLRYEESLCAQGYGRIAGVDEVGRGSWAGPVVAAAVILPLHLANINVLLSTVDDSKKLTPEQRQDAFQRIMSIGASVALGWSSQHVVDTDGLGAANQRALQRAVRNLPVAPQALLVDYFRLSECSLAQVCLPRGDGLSLSIAAASIVAKVVRDRWMVTCDRRYPAYGFASHKGYGTRAHREALKRHGPCALHRRSFAPVAAWRD